jgi:hypothetical protein
MTGEPIHLPDWLHAARSRDLLSLAAAAGCNLPRFVSSQARGPRGAAMSVGVARLAGDASLDRNARVAACVARIAQRGSEEFERAEAPVRVERRGHDPFDRGEYV